MDDEDDVEDRIDLAKLSKADLLLAALRLQERVEYLKEDLTAAEEQNEKSDKRLNDAREEHKQEYEILEGRLEERTDAYNELVKTVVKGVKGTL